MCVGLQVVRHLVLRGVGGARGGKSHPGESVVPSRAEQAERVPAVPPRVTDPLAGVEDHERQTTAAQLVPHGETRLASPDDHGLNALRTTCAAHGSPLWV